MPEIGNRLREARIRKGLTIKDVEDATKIRSKYLEALEEDDYEVLPAPVFAKAFLRTYASYLKIDPDDVVEEYRLTHEPRGDDQAVVRTDSVQAPRSRTSVERKKRRTRRNQRGYVVMAVLAVVAIALLAWFTSGRGDDASSTLDSGSFSSSISTPGTEVEGSTTSETAGAGQPSTTTTAVATGENVVMVLTVSDGSCWLVVREDSENGAELFAGTLTAGGQKTFDSAKRYWMNVGLPEVLGVTINGNVRFLEGDAGAFVVTENGVEPVSLQ